MKKCKKSDFDQHLELAAPKHRSKYTTTLNLLLPKTDIDLHLSEITTKFLFLFFHLSGKFQENLDFFRRLNIFKDLFVKDLLKVKKVKRSAFCTKKYNFFEV